MAAYVTPRATGDNPAMAPHLVMVVAHIRHIKHTPMRGHTLWPWATGSTYAKSRTTYTRKTGGWCPAPFFDLPLRSLFNDFLPLVALSTNT
eukprot:scaffold58630_cov30-Tisochrysis_lutea.AAC.4